MTAIEIKTELHKVIDDIPESALQQALNLLKELTDAEKSKRRAHIDLILKEDIELLKMLAK
jgi:formate dehydrogenase maturation protein FdhE